MFDRCSICKKKATKLVANVYNLKGEIFEFEPRCNKHDWRWQEKQTNW